VGAISINVLCCAINKKLEIGRWERRGLWILGIFMSTIFCTIVVAKPKAAVFAGVMITTVLSSRWFIQHRKARLIVTPDWLAEVKREPLKLDPAKPRIMLAARGREQAEYAVELAHKRNATLFVIFVRTLRVIQMGPSTTPRVEDDPAAQEALGTALMIARQRGVACVPIYISSPDIAEEILDYTVTFGCDTLIIGQSRRSTIARTVEGDVVSIIQKHLPPGVNLDIRETGSVHALALAESVSRDQAQS